MPHIDTITGCLLGGAVGDALGAPVEFMAWPAIESAFGDAGILDFATAYGGLGRITDDTQMMLFTAEGLLRGHVRGSSRGICHRPGVVHHSLLRWLVTQGETPATDVDQKGWLIERKELWARRAPGNTCLTALRSAKHFGDLPSNTSKGCGAVMRVASCAFFEGAFDLAADTGRLTHAHPSGYLSAGLFADLLRRLYLAPDLPLAQATGQSLAEHREREGIEETAAALQRVLAFHAQGIAPTPQRIDAFGGGWVGEEALAIGVWCALFAGDFEEGARLAVNHSGDSDSTGLIAGHLLGLRSGVAGIPQRWLQALELRDAIERIARDLYEVPRTFLGGYGEQDSSIFDAYPGG
ncbi:ADP-ribosylglycohydrolase family protein [Pseudomonas sp. KNUC1026]|uniref:ADP-ribosylglycohydrolase family protein n=1 Tax=Pseudomonas sp. KNUC1026 TaxID=2893890 RepID=UPI001F2503D6|nr:ADP-ribosylglycohydrolase family protein [Pseudomonas sp. KNUC1026]UFH49874.1 ADP-ribosylglycohydrolase family protein [Pseudomonas sp. KNUC1026]